MFNIAFLKTTLHHDQHLCQVVIMESVKDKTEISLLLQTMNLNSFLNDNKNNDKLISHLSSDPVTAQRICEENVNFWNSNNESNQIVLIDIHEAITKKLIKNKMKQEFD